MIQKFTICLFLFLRKEDKLRSVMSRKKIAPIMPIIVFVIIVSSFFLLLLYPAKASVINDEAKAKLIFSRIYRASFAPEIRNFTADFYVRINQSPKYILTTHPDDLTPLMKGRLFWSRPYYLRYEFHLIQPGVRRQKFVIIHTGKFVYTMKNGYDYPLAESVDTPYVSNNRFLPFGLMLPVPPRDVVLTYLGVQDHYGDKRYIIGLMNRTDPWEKEDMIKIWIDAKRHYICKVQAFSEGQKRSTEIVTSGGNLTVEKTVLYKVTLYYKNPVLLPNGYWIPMLIERYENWFKHRKGPGTLAGMVVYSKVSVNDQLPVELFQPPQISLPFTKYVQAGDMP